MPGISRHHLHNPVPSKNADETLEFAQSFAGILESGDIVLLHGPLGSGKTLFVRGICRGLGMEDLWEVSSPTYTLVNYYCAGPGVYHLDLYRIQREEELDSIDFEHILAGPEIKLIEWPERISGSLFVGDGYVVSLRMTGPEDQGREIRIQPFSYQGREGEEPTT